MFICEENDVWPLTITFKDETGAIVAPVSATYRIDDMESSTAIRASTAISVAGTVTIQIGKQDNRILDSTKPHERRQITITAISSGTDPDGNPKQKSQKFDYQVTNLKFL